MEKKLVNALKHDLQLIQPGKVRCFNVINKIVKKADLMAIKKGTVLVLVFDTDTDNIDILKSNIHYIKSQKNIKDVLCLIQVYNLEDELVRSCNIKTIKEFTNSKTQKDFKAEFMKLTNLPQKLVGNNFDIDRMWSESPKNRFEVIKNDSATIKKT